MTITEQQYQDAMRRIDTLGNTYEVMNSAQQDRYNEWIDIVCAYENRMYSHGAPRRSLWRRVRRVLFGVPEWK